MSKKVFQKRFQKECEAMTEYQQGESRRVQKETESVVGANDVPFHAISPVSTCGNQLEGASSASALQTELLKSGENDTSKLLHVRDRQNPSEKPTQIQSYLPVSKNHPIRSNVATKDISRYARQQSRSEEPLIEDVKGASSSIKDKRSSGTSSEMQLQEDFVRRKYICDVCSKEYKYESQLRKHYLTHTGEKRFACDVCGKKVIKKGNLTIHKRIHTGEKRFSCDICEKRFTQKGNLDRHRITHSSEKPYKCDVCGKEFNDPSNRNSHRKKTHRATNHKNAIIAKENSV